MDQTGGRLFPMPQRTLAEKGAKHIKLLGLEDKRQFTLVPAVSAA